MKVTFSLQDLTWQVVEGDEVSDLLILVLNYDGVHHLFSWHQVMAELILGHFETNLISFLLFLVEAKDLWEIFGLHESWGSENVDTTHAINLGSLVVSSH